MMTIHDENNDEDLLKIMIATPSLSMTTTKIDDVDEYYDDDHHNIVVSVTTT
jgi:hypothetical protein